MEGTEERIEEVCSSLKAQDAFGTSYLIFSAIALFWQHILASYI